MSRQTCCGGYDKHHIRGCIFGDPQFYISAKEAASPAPEPRAPQPDVMEALNRVIQDSKLRHIEQKVWQNLFERLTNLVHEAGKIAVEMGEDWRVNHPEFMDSLEAASVPPAAEPRQHCPECE